MSMDKVFNKNQRLFISDCRKLYIGNYKRKLLKLKPAFSYSKLSLLYNSPSTFFLGDVVHVEMSDAASVDYFP